MADANKKAVIKSELNSEISVIETNLNDIGNIATQNAESITALEYENTLRTMYGVVNGKTIDGSTTCGLAKVKYYIVPYSTDVFSIEFVEFTISACTGVDFCDYTGFTASFYPEFSSWGKIIQSNNLTVYETGPGSIQMNQPVKITATMGAGTSFTFNIPWNGMNYTGVNITGFTITLTTYALRM